MSLFAFINPSEAASISVFFAIVAFTFWLLNMISSRNSHAEERLERIGRPKSLIDMDINTENRDRFTDLKKAFSSLGGAMEPQSELEKSSMW